MTDAEIEQQLAVLGFQRQWVALGVLTDEWLDPAGSRRSRLAAGATDAADAAEDLLHQALYEYLAARARAGVDDGTLAGLLDVAARADETCASLLASWAGLTLAQLAHVAGHDGAGPEIRRLARQRLRVHALETDDVPDVDLIGLGGDGLDDLPDPPTGFEVRGFRFTVAWERRLSSEERRHVGGLLAILPAGEPMRCHTPVFGLRLDAGTLDETRMSLCFTCNNAYLDGGGVRTLDGESPPARQLLAYLMDLAPSAWRVRFGG